MQHSSSLIGSPLLSTQHNTRSLTAWVTLLLRRKIKYLNICNLKLFTSLLIQHQSRSYKKNIIYLSPQIFSSCKEGMSKCQKWFKPR